MGLGAAMGFRGDDGLWAMTGSGAPTVSGAAMGSRAVTSSKTVVVCSRGGDGLQAQLWASRAATTGSEGSGDVLRTAATGGVWRRGSLVSK
ncbi:hypothetical protein GUJ93_ZPchr0011g27320 [Zizania palustris]|uniref:Uncharacterized protein n=1 Tax=Zizania palustris TaxID=103762 RepID=A0A8J5WHB6_ZIZPA|nr:hypothetical protein GUJ93_ZPchr0011g27320 [Zizania palustris]